MITIPKISFLNRNSKQSERVNANAEAQNRPAHIYIYDTLKNKNFGANLAPLEYDTISFGNASRKNNQKATQEEKDIELGKVRKTPKARAAKKLDQADRASLRLAKGLQDDVDFAYKRLRSDIASIFNMRILETDDSHFDSAYHAELIENITNQRPVLAITSRKKSAKSIAEKMGHMKLTSKNDALENIHDMVGIRILVSNSDKKSGEYVGDKLLKAVKNGWIKISEIEVYRNPALSPASRYDYIDEKRLDAIAMASRKKVKDFNYVIRQTDFGYSAIHMGVNLPGGIKGEIQIISPRVAAFKDIEDICYKGLSGKTLPKGYARLKASFEKLDPKINKEAYDEFAEYTRQAYAFERKRRSRDTGPFLSIPEGSKIPPRLDFNYIAGIKEELDNTRREKEAIKMREEVARLIDNIGVEDT